MPAPQEIIALLESVVGVFLSEVRHRERAAFLLCDVLVEMTCKNRAVEESRQFDTLCGFYTAWNAPGVQLDPGGLGKRVQQRRETRNLMQHQSAAATVEVEQCADAILDAVAVIDHCWSGSSSEDVRLWAACALRILRLYSSAGDLAQRDAFEHAMRTKEWEFESDEKPSANEIVVRPGERPFWLWAITRAPDAVEETLNGLEL
jgi:hypothetical protein